MKLELGMAASLARRLAWMLERGAPLPEALERTAAGSPRAGAALAPILAEVRKGASLAESFRRGGEAFPEVLVHSLVGEDLVASLHESSRLLEESRQLRLDLEQALAYPRFLLVILGLLSVFLYGCTASTLNPASQPHPLLLAVTLLLLATGGWLLSGSPSGDLLRWRLPLLGDWLRRRETAGLVRWLEHLLRLGLPLDQALSVASEGCQSETFRTAVLAAVGRVKAGSPLVQALAGTVPEIALWLIGRAEGLGFPAGQLGGIGDMLSRELKLASRRGLEVLGPALLFLIGMLLLLVCWTLYLPMYGRLENL